MWRIVQYRKTGEWRLYRGTMLAAANGWTKAQAQAELIKRLEQESKATCPNCGVMVLGVGTRTIHQGTPALRCTCGMLYKHSGWEHPDDAAVICLP